MQEAGELLAQSGAESLCRAVALRTLLLAKASGQAASLGAWGAVPAGSEADVPGLRAVTKAQFKRWCVPDVQLGA